MKFSENERLSTAIALQSVSARDLELTGVDQNLISAAMDREVRGASFHSIFDRWSASRNMTTRRTPTEKADLFIQACAHSEMMAAAGFSPINLGSIVDDAINKVVRVKFLSIPSVIPSCCRQIDNSNYRPISNYQLTSGAFLQRISDSGELTHMSVKDSATKYEVDDTGGYLGIPRKYIVNDDMGVIKSIGDLLGLRGKQTLERDFHIMLLTATWGATNKLTGVESAFSYSALKLAHQLWANQESDGAPIAVGGSVLLLQSGSMELDGKDLNKSEKVMVRSDNTVDRTEANVFQGTLTNIVGTPWLRHSTMGANKSATAWFEFSDPNVHSMFEVAYLGGPDGEGRVPRVETAQMPFTSLGLQMRVLFSYGMGQVDSVGAVYATGVAP